MFWSPVFVGNDPIMDRVKEDSELKQNDETICRGMNSHHKWFYIIINATVLETSDRKDTMYLSVENLGKVDRKVTLTRFPGVVKVFNRGHINEGSNIQCIHSTIIIEIPSPDEILKECEKIRNGWKPWEEEMRRVEAYRNRRAILPNVFRGGIIHRNRGSSND